MLLQSERFAERLPTVLTLVSHSQVELLMCGQVAFALEGLVALVAGKGGVGGVLDSVAFEEIDAWEVDIAEVAGEDAAVSLVHLSVVRQSSGGFADSATFLTRQSFTPFL